VDLPAFSMDALLISLVKVVLCAVDEQQHAESNRGLNRNELPDHAQSYKMSLFYEYSMT